MVFVLVCPSAVQEIVIDWLCTPELMSTRPFSFMVAYWEPEVIDQVPVVICPFFIALQYNVRPVKVLFVNPSIWMLNS